MALSVVDGSHASFPGLGALRDAFACGVKAGRGLAAYLIAMSAGLAVMLLGSSERLRRKYLRRTLIAYAFAVVVMAVMFSFDDAGQPFIACN